MSSTVEPAVAGLRGHAHDHTHAVAAAAVEVDEVDEEFGADAADEALWVPVSVGAGT